MRKKDRKKNERKNIWIKIKNTSKLNKLFLYVFKLFFICLVYYKSITKFQNM